MRIARTLLVPQAASSQPKTAARPGQIPVHAPLVLARAAFAAGHHAAALAHFDAAVAAEPTLSLAHLGRAVCLLSLGRAEEGVLALDDALSSGGDDGDVMVTVARACVSIGDGSLAMDVLGIALSAFPSLASSVAHDPGFVRLRDHPRFLQLVGQL